MSWFSRVLWFLFAFLLAMPALGQTQRTRGSEWTPPTRPTQGPQTVPCPDGTGQCAIWIAGRSTPIIYFVYLANAGVLVDAVREYDAFRAQVRLGGLRAHALVNGTWPSFARQTYATGEAVERGDLVSLDRLVLVNARSRQQPFATHCRMSDGHDPYPRIRGNMTLDNMVEHMPPNCEYQGGLSVIDGSRVLVPMGGLTISRQAEMFMDRFASEYQSRDNAGEVLDLVIRGRAQFSAFLRAPMSNIDSGQAQRFQTLDDAAIRRARELAAAPATVVVEPPPLDPNAPVFVDCFDPGSINTPVCSDTLRRIQALGFVRGNVSSSRPVMGMVGFVMVGMGIMFLVFALRVRPRWQRLQTRLEGEIEGLHQLDGQRINHLDALRRRADSREPFFQRLVELFELDPDFWKIDVLEQMIVQSRRVAKRFDMIVRAHYMQWSDEAPDEDFNPEVCLTKELASIRQLRTFWNEVQEALLAHSHDTHPGKLVPSTFSTKDLHEALADCRDAVNLSRKISKIWFDNFPSDEEESARVLNPVHFALALDVMSHRRKALETQHAKREKLVAELDARVVELTNAIEAMRRTAGEAVGFGDSLGVERHTLRMGPGESGNGADTSIPAPAKLPAGLGDANDTWIDTRHDSEPPS